VTWTATDISFESSVVSLGFLLIGDELFLDTSSVFFKTPTGVKMGSFASESCLLHPP